VYVCVCTIRERERELAKEEMGKLVGVIEVERERDSRVDPCRSFSAIF
jgi:hypothetical protein